jgi:DHA1 family tetracycline resistance protein-like MFS transporter
MLWSAAIYNLHRAFKLREFRAIFAVIFLYVMGFSFFVLFFQVYLIDRFHYTQSELGLQMAYTGLWIIFTQGVLIRPVTRLFSARQVLKGSLLLLSMAIGAILLPDRGWLFLFVLPFTAMGQGLSMPTSTAIVSGMARRSEQGEILGLSQSVSAVAMFVTPLIGGELAGWNTSAPILAGSLTVLAAWVMYMVLFSGEGKRNERV